MRYLDYIDYFKFNFFIKIFGLLKLVYIIFIFALFLIMKLTINLNYYIISLSIILHIKSNALHNPEFHNIFDQNWWLELVLILLLLFL